jgi:hypothetical protein
LIAVAIQALGIVTTLAPGALTVGSLPPTSISTPVPTPNLSVENYSTSLRWIGVWNLLVPDLEAVSPESTWSVPPGCGETCSFKVQYEAPALSCRDLLDNEYTVVPYSPSTDSWMFYDFNTGTLSMQTNWTKSNPEFIVNYIPMSYRRDHPTVVSSDPPTGSMCQCKDGTYEAEFTYANKIITLATKIISYSNKFTGTCTEVDSETASNGCQNYKSNAIQICGRFTTPLHGQHNITAGRPPGNLYDAVIYERLFNVSFDATGEGNVYFQPKFTNLSETLTSFFSNVTVGLLPKLNETATTSVEVLDSTRRWKYEPKTLFAVYTPALAAVLVIIAYGLYCIHANGRPMDNKFSTLLLTTRSGELDGIYDTADDFNALMSKKLVYAKRGYFVPETRESSQDPVKEA